MRTSIRAFLWRILHLNRRTKSEATLDRELRFHLQMEIEQNLRQGMSHEEARRQALISLGGVEQTKEACRETCAIRWAAEFRQDLRYGWRMLCKSPRFTAIAVLTLALGIGANTAIFSAVNGILLQPLPYPDSSRLVTIKRQQIAYGIRFGELGEIERQCTALECVEIWEGGWLSLRGGAGTRHLSGSYVSSGFFSLLGVKPLLGRPILPEDTQPGNDRVAVLSHHLWMDEFGGDMGIVGRSITVGDKPYAIIGVMPGEFGVGVDFSLSFGSPDRVWLPRVVSPPGALNRRAGSSIVARLKTDATPTQADAQLQPLSTRFAAAYRAGAKGLELSARSLEPGIDPHVRTVLWILLGAVGFVLLMACVNVTSLLVARSWTRRRELAIRNALGASRLRIARQLLSESLLLVLAGGALGLLFSVWGIHLLRVLAPPYTPRVDRILLDAKVLGFTMGVSLFCTNTASEAGGHIWMEIIGVVNDVRDRALTEPSPVFYMPFGSSSQGFKVIAHTSGNPMLLVPTMKRVVRSVDKDAQIDHIETVDQILANSVAEPRFQTALVGSFGGLALLLAIIGVYGVISHSVVQRTHEIGVRIALGAQRRDVLFMILREGMLLVVTGIAIGIGGGLALTRVLRNMLFEIAPTDPATFVGVPIFLAIAALAACFIPAQRATRVDPMLTLRNE